MKLYYADGDRKIGPIDKSQLMSLIKAKKVNSRTLVWRPGMENWLELRNLVRNNTRVDVPTQQPESPATQKACTECSRSFPPDELMPYNGALVCADCKPHFVQKLKEGLAVAGDMAYAGFWIRGAAISIDIVILMIVNQAVVLPLQLMMPDPSEGTALMFALIPLMMIFQYVIPAAYDTWFIGKFAATPGKMACKLKVVKPDGEKVGFLLAFGRHFARWVSSIILGIGFIMAAFDDQKRGLHDRMCETRVVRK